MLGLPDTISAFLFDLDGVLTKTATVHAHARKQMFDDFLEALGEPPFELPGEYDRYVDGKPRYDGVRSFLAARGIDADEKLVHALADRKNDLVLAMVRTDGVEAGRNGSFGFVAGVDRSGRAQALSSHRADIVVADLAELLERPA